LVSFWSLITTFFKQDSGKMSLLSIALSSMLFQNDLRSNSENIDQKLHDGSKRCVSLTKTFIFCGLKFRIFFKNFQLLLYFFLIYFLLFLIFKLKKGGPLKFLKWENLGGPRSVIFILKLSLFLSLIMTLKISKILF